MTVTAEWEDDTTKDIIRVTFGQTWDMDEFFSVCEETIRPMFDSIDHTAHVLVEFTSLYVPSHVVTRFNQIAQTPQLTHENSGILIVWGGPRLIDSMGNMFIRVFGMNGKMLMVADEAAARAHLAAHNASD